MDIYSSFDRNKIIDSFDFIENFVNEHIKNGKVTPDTDSVVSQFTKEIEKLNDLDFSFLLLHSGYIPDYYDSDSSDETLYSKLIEALVCEWSKRIGFNKSYLQKVKSNKEDVTIVKDNDVIVCDAKSFRLGRSQSAPNVKDVIKKAAYETWLNAYSEMNKIGGIVTFPSLHKHKKGSEAFQYFMEGNPSIMMLTYEEMAFLLLKSFHAEDIIFFLTHYETIFPNPSRKADVYMKGIIDYLFNKKSPNDYQTFIQDTKKYISLKVDHAIDVLNKKMIDAKEQITNDIMKKSFDDLRNYAIETKYQKECLNIMEKEKNIRKFRHI